MIYCIRISLQYPLSSNQQQQILGQLTHLTQLNDALATLDIALGFIIAVGDMGHKSIPDFIVNVLHIDNPNLDTEAIKRCELAHTKALWVLLSQARSQLLASYDQVT
jgi:hypothetical protein